MVSSFLLKKGCPFSSKEPTKRPCKALQPNVSAERCAHNAKYDKKPFATISQNRLEHHAASYLFEKFKFI